ncbi:Mpo1 family 2-hydroxy fatty acid dioxygenase [Mucilaginibacter sp. HD30]
MKNQSKTKQPEIAKRPVDVVMDEYASFHTNPTNRIMNYICIPLVSFGILAFVWSIPFPKLEFLGKNQTFINWASFVVASALYYYLRLSPMLSYLMLFLLGVFSYVIVSLEHTFVLAQIGLVLFVIGNIGQLIGYKNEGRRPVFAQDFKFMLIAPMWLLSLILKRFKIRY